MLWACSVERFNFKRLKFDETMKGFSKLTKLIEYAPTSIGEIEDHIHLTLRYVNYDTKSSENISFILICCWNCKVFSRYAVCNIRALYMNSENLSIRDMRKYDENKAIDLTVIYCRKPTVVDFRLIALKDFPPKTCRYTYPCCFVQHREL